MTDWPISGPEGRRDGVLNAPGSGADPPSGHADAGDHLRRLWLVSAALRGVTSIPELLAIILRQGASCLGADTGVVYLREPNGHLRLTASVGLAVHLVTGPAEQVAPELAVPATAAMQTGAAVWVQNREERATRFPAVDALAEGMLASATVPLLVAGDRTLGVLVLGFDHERPITADERLFLLTLASVGAYALDWMYATEAAQTRGERLATALAAAEVGWFDWDIATDKLTWDDRMCGIFGVTPGEFEPRIATLFAQIHPEDVPAVQAAVGHAVATCGELAVEHRVRQPGGAVRWVSERGRVLPGPDGQPETMVGTAVDTTELRDARERLVRTLEHMTDGFCSFDLSWRFRYVNAEAERMLGTRREDLLGMPVWDLRSQPLGPEFRRRFERAVADRTPMTFEEALGRSGVWAEVRAEPSPDGLAVYLRDATERRAAQQRITMLEWVASTLTHALTTADIVAAIRTQMRVLLGAHTISLALLDDSGRMRVLDLDQTPTPQDGQWRTVPHGAALPVAEAVRDELPMFCGSVEEMAATRPYLVPAARRSGAEAWASLPLVASGHVHGGLGIGWRDAREFAEMDRAFYITVAVQCAQALARAALYERERSIAERLQRNLLPGRLPHLPGVDIAVRYVSAEESAEVGGDFYDVFASGGGAWMIAVGDVSGRGVEAAGITGMARHTLRAVGRDLSPARALARLNEVLYESTEPDKFVTAACMRLRLRGDGTAVTTLSSGGHPLPILVRADGSVEMPGQFGTLLGVVPRARLVDTQFVLGAEDVLVLYTDGIIEARGGGGLFGEDRLASILVQSARQSVDGIADRVLAEVARYRTTPSADDIALVVLRLASTSVTAALRHGVAIRAGHELPLPVEPVELAGVDVEPEVADTVLVPSLTAPREARRFSRRSLARAGVDSDTAGLVELLTSELVTNAVRYGEGPIGLRVRVRPERLRVLVSDGSPVPPVTRHPAPSELSGRGMLIVDSLASRWGVDPEPFGKTVWFDLDLG